MIRIEHLGKSYGTHTVLSDVSANIAAGEVICIVGPSGCGKSTLLRCLNGLETPTRGRIWFKDQDLSQPGVRMDVVRQSMNMVFQSFNLFAHLSVLDNLTLAPVQLKRTPLAQAQAKAMGLLESVGLADWAHHLPEELSGGQKQRVAIARCLAMDPEVILMDEPTSALDPTMVSEVLAVIRRLARQGLTLIIVTHEMAFAREVAHRVFYMDERGIYEQGPPEQVFGAPQRPKTRAFVQRIRSLQATIASGRFDWLSLQGQAEQFCEKHALSTHARNHLILFLEEASVLLRPAVSAGQSFGLVVEYGEADRQLTVGIDLAPEVAKQLQQPIGDDTDLGVRLIRAVVKELQWSDGDIYPHLRAGIEQGAITDATTAA